MFSNPECVKYSAPEDCYYGTICAWHAANTYYTDGECQNMDRYINGAYVNMNKTLNNGPRTLAFKNSDNTWMTSTKNGPRLQPTDIWIGDDQTFCKKKNCKVSSISPELWSSYWSISPFNENA